MGYPKHIQSENPNFEVAKGHPTQATIHLGAHSRPGHAPVRKSQDGLIIPATANSTLTINTT